MKRRVRCRFSGATQRAPGRPLQRSRRRLRKVSGRAMATKRRMADKRPEARGEAPGRHASKWGLRAGIGIELVEFLDRKSTRLNSVTNSHLVCRLLLEQKNTNSQKQ